MREVVEPDRLVTVPGRGGRDVSRVSSGLSRSRTVVSVQREKASETHCAMIRKTRKGEWVVCSARSRDLHSEKRSERVS